MVSAKGEEVGEEPREQAQRLWELVTVLEGAWRVGRGLLYLWGALLPPAPVGEEAESCAVVSCCATFCNADCTRQHNTLGLEAWEL